MRYTPRMLIAIILGSFLLSIGTKVLADMFLDARIPLVGLFAGLVYAHNEGIAFGIRLYEKPPKSELDDRVEGALRRAALWDEVKDKLKSSGMGLSGGQQQRLCIARTIAQKPEVILFDEPTSALDPISTGKIEDLLEQLKTDFTIVIVTHNMQQAARISQYTAFMYLGEVIEFAPTNTIFMNPHKKQTQDYVTGRFG